MAASPSQAIFQQQQAWDRNNNDGSCTDNVTNSSSSTPSNFGYPIRNKITKFFQVSRTAKKQEQTEKKDLIYIAAENLTAEDLVRAGGRTTITVNDKELVLIAHKDLVYAIESKCPHIGGPLDQGDIEDVPGCGPCIKCPWHSWTFSLTSGRCVAPQNRARNAETFPVLLSPSNNTIKIGFTEISPKTFNELPE